MAFLIACIVATAAHIDSDSGDRSRLYVNGQPNSGGEARAVGQGDEEVFDFGDGVGEGGANGGHGSFWKVKKKSKGILILSKFTGTVSLARHHKR